MSEIPRRYECEMCKRVFVKQTAVRNDVVLQNGEHSRMYGEMCDNCATRIAELLDKAFPRNKYVEK